MLFKTTIYTHILCRYTHETSRHKFEGSDSLFPTQQSLVNEAGCRMFPTFHSHEIRSFTIFALPIINFLWLYICCALTGTYPAYIAGVFTSYYRTKPVIAGLHIARTASTILDNIYSETDTFVFGNFQFLLTQWEEYEAFPDFFIYDITFEHVTVPFQITLYMSLHHADQNLS